MSAHQYESKTADKFIARLPDGLRAEIEAIANANDRSMNSVFVQAVRQYLDNQNRQGLLLEALAASVSTGQTKQLADPRDLFIAANPVSVAPGDLEKGCSGFVDHRTHADYLIFLAGYQAAQEFQL
ncbi:Arc family DNA-binding protein [Pseudomonas sp. WS 5414]|uniref:CopG family ribbon-helix-helix protein n=1 Tax=Pseudomonas sp. WS 5414 TaxID=2717478 RepID=UPI0014727027|nr:Arc family DNA-binding protein [Pseudomonas sp. WS 5414]NMY67333.1 Arc family DNA-binding protein [Pseudomonas sp. WS 5414]